MQPKHVAIVAPEFPPCNLAAVHRSRLFALHLKEFGFEPTVVTIEPRYYEVALDWDLAKTIPADLRVLRTKALPTRPVRLVGDLGIRSFWPIYRRLARLMASHPIDLLFLPIPPYYSALFGPLFKRRFGVPYVIDYIDPWVYPITEQEKRSWKARLSHRLARWLEPVAVSRADGITGVAAGYYEGVLERHPHLRTVPTAGIPYGGEAADHELVRESGRASALLEQGVCPPGKLILAYAGALLPRAISTLRALFAACGQLRQEQPQLAQAMHWLFVGTGSRLNDPESGQVVAIAREMGVADMVSEAACRQPYFEVLALLDRAHAVLILGSSERHYTASKTFQALHSQRPILALLHEESTAAEILRTAPAVELVTFGESHPAEERVPEMAAALARLLRLPPQTRVARDNGSLEPYSARAMTRHLANVFRQVLERASPRGGPVDKGEP
jgi:hypothetical protein